ncbi:GPCR-chaperone-domain-containing protein [Obelidium mucronatum]|nr:GPCR-chaperone-domain-containing protein [Obelidium mucronatum]
MDPFALIQADEVAALSSLLFTNQALVREKSANHNLLTFAIASSSYKCIELLLCDFPDLVLQKTDQGWSAIQEATSIGDRNVMKQVLKVWRVEMLKWVEEKGRALLKALSSDLTDFYLEIKWEFSSWIPFLPQLCPSDVCKIWKCGKRVRIDTTLVGFESMSWIRGDLSLIFTEASGDGGPKLVVIDHQRRLVQQIYPNDFSLSSHDLEQEISILLNTPIISPPRFDFSQVNISRAQTGMLFKTNCNEKVSGWETSVWNLDGLSCICQERHEHLNPALETSSSSDGSESEIGHKNDTKNSGGTHPKSHLETSKIYRPSLIPPTNPFSDANDVVGRSQELRVTKKQVSAMIWMHDPDAFLEQRSLVSWLLLTPDSSAISPNLRIVNTESSFPISMHTVLLLLELLEITHPNHHATTLKDFLLQGGNSASKMPRGFPVKVEIPLGMVPLNLVVTFENMQLASSSSQNSLAFRFEEGLFDIPGKRKGYLKGDVLGG